MSTSLVGQNSRDAVGYLQRINNTISQTKGETWRYLKSVTRGRSARTQERKRQQLIEELSSVIGQLQEIPGYNGDTYFRDQVISYLNLTLIVMREDYGEIMDLEAIAEESYDDMEAYLKASEIAGEKLDSAFEIYSDAQSKFAFQNNINLVEGEMSRQDERISRAGSAINYYNDVFLVVFKAQIQEIHALDALGRNDLISLEQSSSAMLTAVDEGMAILDTMSYYNGDANLILGARRCLQFYREESEEVFPTMVDFFVAKQEFEQLKTAIEAIDQRDLTQEDIDEYNSALERYNDLVPEFNDANEDSNEKRQDAMEEWEERIEEFFDNNA